jgi:hypothetical protein
MSRIVASLAALFLAAFPLQPKSTERRDFAGKVLEYSGVLAGTF